MATVIWGMTRITRQMFFFPPDASLDPLRGLLWSNCGNKESGHARCQLLSCFFNEQFPWWLWCLESRVKLVYHRLRIGWLRNKLADEFFPCNWWLARILLKNGLLSAEAPSFHLGFCKILPSRPGHCVFLFFVWLLRFPPRGPHFFATSCSTLLERHQSLVLSRYLAWCPLSFTS